MSEAVECPKCGSLKSRVVDARPRTDPIPHFFRRRCCCLCGERYSTREFLDNVSFNRFIDETGLSGLVRAAVMNILHRMLAITRDVSNGGPEHAPYMYVGWGQGGPRVRVDLK